MRRGFLAALVVGSGLAPLLVAPPAAAQVIAVPPGGSIHQAVKSAQPGDTIQLSAGLYEDVVSVKTNDITIQGVGSGTGGTVLRPPADLPGRCFRGTIGICVLGDFQEGTPVEGVTISGIRVEDFVSTGLLGFLTIGLTFEGNAVVGSADYGFAAFESQGIAMRNNVASGIGFTGLYVGDTRRAHAAIEGNEAFDATFGLFLRDTSGGDVTGNVLHDNCIGALIFDTPEAVRAGNYTFSANEVRHNTAFCRGGGPEDPSTAGTGIAIADARRVTIEANTIARNRTTRDVPFHGGVVLVSFGGPGPSDNTVTGNTLIRNRPNIFTDGSGSGNVIENNVCTPGC